MAVAQILYLFLPLLPGMILLGIVSRYDLFPWLNRPLDGGAMLRGHRLFGANKTWRGVACSWAGSILTVAAQKYIIGDKAGNLAIIDYGQANVFWLGTALSLGATLGELFNSFVKRQLDVAPGKPHIGRLRPVFYIFDQVDALVTTWPLLLFWLRPGWLLVALSFVLILVIHQAISLIGYAMGLRESIA
jgi:CDP-2,3-bis-(O-geranylgeranyl)-sn-glycerol synthase